MISFKSALVRTLGIATVATGVLLGSALSVSADTRSDSYSTLSSSPPLPTFDAETSNAGTERDVVIGDITPEERRTTTSGDLKAGTDTARGGTANYGGADDFKAGAGCSIQCITSGVAYARGVGANLVVKTDTAATIWIIVWNDDGYHKMVNSEAGLLEFAHHFDDLEPGTSYQAMAAAEDGEGYTSHGYGEFTTLSRNVRVSFTQAIIDEKPFSGPIDMKAWLQGQVIADNADNVLEGDTLPIGITIADLGDSERFITLEVFLVLFDSGEDLCEAFGEADEPAIGQHDCYAWAYAEFQGGSLDVDDRPNGATSWTQHTIQTNLVLPGGNALPGGYGQPFDFHVPVSINVTYE
jgi:hypothetical protein